MTDIYCAFGDSTTAGVRNVSTAATGVGSYVEILAELLAQYKAKPVLGPGIRGQFLDLAGSDITTEWTHSGVFTQILGNTPYGLVYSGAGGTTATWTAPARWRPIMGGFCVYWMDLPTASGYGSFQYSINGGARVTMPQSRTGSTNMCKFYVSSAAQVNTVQFFGNNGSIDVKMVLYGIEPFYLNPLTTDGVIFHNVAITGHALGQMDDATAGGFDGYQFVDNVTVMAGAPSHYPNAGCIEMNINDVNYADVPRWNTNLTAFNTRLSPHGPVMFINVWANTPANYNLADQVAYRAQMETTGVTLGVPVLDHFNYFDRVGFHTHAQTQLGGFITVDMVHESDQAHILFANRIFWKMVKHWYSGVAHASRFPVNGARPAAAVNAGKTGPAVHAHVPLTMSPLKSPFTESIPPVFNRRIPQDLAATGTTAVTATFARTATLGSLLVFVVHSVGAGAGNNPTPSGWTLGVDVGSGTHDLTAFWKISDGTETAVTCTPTSAASVTQGHFFESYTLDKGVTVVGTSSAANTFGATETSEITSAGAGIAVLDPRSIAFVAAGQNGTNGGATGGGWVTATPLLVTSELMSAYYLPGTTNVGYTDQANWNTARAGLVLAIVFKPSS